MTDLRQAATLALDALELSAVTVDSFGVQKATQAAIAALRTALEQQAEPVAWVCMNGEKHDIDFDQPEIDAIPVGTFLFTTPPQRPWQGMTEQDMPSGEDPMFDHQFFIAGMVYAATVLKERNT